MRNNLYLFLLPLCFLTTDLFAATEQTLENLNQLVTDNRFEEAYILAVDLMDENEGEPEFDFLYGLTALETGRYSEAVFAFERIALIYPDQQRVKLELARALFLSNNLIAAAQLFNEVLATNPEPNVRENIELFLQQITDRENTISGSFNFFLTSNLGNDSNINSATELGVIKTPIGDIELSANGQSIKDYYIDAGAGISYVKPLSKASTVNLLGNFSKHKNFASTLFDLDVKSGELNYARVFNDKFLSVAARVQSVDLDSMKFQKSASLITNWQRTTSLGWTQGLTGAYTAVRYDTAVNPNANLRDVDQVLLSAVLGKTVGIFYNTISAYYGDEQIKVTLGKNNAQRFYGLAFAEQIQFRENHIPFMRLSLHKSDNKSKDPIFDIQRRDSTFSSTFGWSWQASENINATTDVTFTQNKSNLDIFKYDRVKYQTGIRYQF